MAWDGADPGWEIRMCWSNGPYVSNLSFPQTGQEGGARAFIVSCQGGELFEDVSDSTTIKKEALKN
jgi:hypothetical protein